MLIGSRILMTTAGGAVEPISPLAPVRSSAGLGWQGLHLEEHATPPMEMPPAAPQDDLVWLQLNPVARHEMRAGGEWQPLPTSAGTVGVRPRGRLHSGRWDDEIRAVVVAIRPPLIRGAAAALGVDPAGLTLSTGPDSAARHLILALRDEVESGGSGGLLFADSIGMALAIHLLRRYAPERAGEPAPRLLRPQLRRALDFIAAHLGDNPSLREIAAAAGLSQFHFARQFKESLGLSPHQFMLRARIERAKYLLAGSNRSLVEVSLVTGFANQSHFTTAFKRLVGVTPKRYRERA